MNVLFIFAYKIIGFITLIIICIGILGYLIGSIFFIIDKRWIIPIILSPNSERVIQINSEYTQQKFLLNKIEIEKFKIESQISLINEQLDIKKNLQKRFEIAFQNDLKFKKAKLLLVNEEIQEHEKMKTINSQEYSQSVLSNIESLISAGVIDKYTYNQKRFSVDQNLINLSNYQQKEEQLKLEKETLEKNIYSLQYLSDKIKNKKNQTDAPIYDILLIEQEYLNLSQIIKELENEIITLKAESNIAERTINDYTKICQKIKQSPYYLALSKNIIVAFSPYSNLKNIKIDDPIYGCYIGLIICKKVAIVKEILEGEIIAKHPVFNKELRGKMIIIDMLDMHSNNIDWAEVKSLHVGTKPFFLL